MENTSDSSTLYRKAFWVMALVNMILVFLLIVLARQNSNSASDKIDTLTSEIRTLRVKVDSLDNTIKADTLKVAKTRETVKVIDRGLQEVRSNVATMPPDALAQMFRDTALKYGRR